ncbi:MAG: GEVED domain-containing protein [Thiohalomonadales bacterium]
MNFSGKIYTHFINITLLWLALITFPSISYAAYCTSSAQNSSYEWVEKFQINNYSKLSGNNNGYADFTLDPAIPLTTTSTFTLTPGFNGNSYTEYWNVWIDFNQNNIFESTESVFSGNANAALNGTITIPGTALSGTTRMRVSMKYGSIASPCESFAWGEVEDYTVNINTAVLPFNLILDNNFNITRSGIIGDPVTWVIEQDGVIVLQRNAANELNYSYFNNTPGSQYRIWLKQFINNQYKVVSNTVSYNIPDPNAPVTYCAAQGNNTNYEWINSVMLNTITKTSGSNNGYADFTSDPAINIDKGTNTLGVYPGFSATNYTENWKIWVDLNQDGIFTTNELLFTQSSQTSILSQLIIPDTALTGETRMRIILSYSPSASTPACGSFTYGEVEDYTVNISNQTAKPPVATLYTLNVSNNYQLSRTGQLGDNVNWVIEKDGTTVLARNASSEMTYTYFSNSIGSKFRVWLTVGGQAASNIVEYEPGTIVSSHSLNLISNYTVQRSGILGEALTWVIEKDGIEVLRRNAANELEYTYFNNIQNSYYRVWLEQFNNGAYEIVSNVIQYTPGIQVFSHNLTLSNNYNVTRNGTLTDPVTWVVEQDGIIVSQQNNNTSLRFTYPGFIASSSYRIWLTQIINTQEVIVSNTIEFIVNANFGSYALTIDPNFQVSRTGNLGDNVSWVIEKNDTVVLQRLASNELSYTYFSNTPGSKIRIWLQQFIGGGYYRISNISEYTVP